MKKEEKYLIELNYESQNRFKHLLKSFAHEIESNGFVKMISDEDVVNIYQPEIALILVSEEFPVLNLNNNKKELINGRAFQDDFIKGFKEGEAHFNEEYKVSTNTLYGDNSKKYVEDLLHKYYEKGDNQLSTGWSIYVRNGLPYFITSKSIWKIGYYSGIVSKVDELMLKYPAIFISRKKYQSNEEISFKELYDNPTSKKIYEIIDAIHDKGWEYAFNSRKDLDSFINILTCFSEQKEYKLPDELIRLRKGSKTSMATIIKKIHQELSDRPLYGDDEFFNIVQILHPFVNDSNLYKTISR